MVSLAISAVFSTPSRMRAESKCVSAKHTVRSLTQAFWKSMHEALAQLNSPRDCWMYERYALGLPGRCWRPPGRQRGRESTPRGGRRAARPDGISGWRRAGARRTSGAAASAWGQGSNIEYRGLVERAEPAFDLGGLWKPPSGALAEQRQGWPDDAVGIAPTLGSVEEIRELRDRGEAPARGSDRLPVALEDPRPLLGREPEEKGGQVIAERSDAHPIPIDELCPQSSGGRGHEGVDRPQIAVEQGIGPPRLPEHPPPPRGGRPQAHQTHQQPPRPRAGTQRSATRRTRSATPGSNRLSTTERCPAGPLVSSSRYTRCLSRWTRPTPPGPSSNCASSPRGRSTSLVSRTAETRGSRARSSTFPTTRRASKCSWTSARARAACRS